MEMEAPPNDGYVFDLNISQSDDSIPEDKNEETMEVMRPTKKAKFDQAPAPLDGVFSQAIEEKKPQVVEVYSKKIHSFDLNQLPYDDDDLSNEQQIELFANELVRMHFPTCVPSAMNLM